MISFAVGPVMMDQAVKNVGSEDIPYFRTTEFGAMMLDNEKLMKKFLYAPKDARVVFLTASGTGAMECAVINCLTKEDKVLVINGGSFGARWLQLCEQHEIPHTEVKVKEGNALHKEDLRPFEKAGYTALLIQAAETSTGVKYDLQMVSDFCKANGIFLIVDAVSAFLADTITMEKWGINVVLTGSQKGLAVPPGISVLCFDQKAIKRAQKINIRMMYFNIPSYLTNMERGQTPFTPACSILKQINVRLHEIDDEGGVEKETARVEELAHYFRDELEKASLPFELFAETPANGVTSLKVLGKTKAHDLFDLIFKKYDIYLCPNGGDLKDVVFRVGHIGSLKKQDYSRLIAVLSEMNKNGEL
jgi:aspartate aminotransferase-like enzyme